MKPKIKPIIIIIYMSCCIKLVIKNFHVVMTGFILSVFAQSCFYHDNYGYPSAAYFSADGGTKMLNGLISLDSIEFEEGSERDFKTRHEYTDTLIGTFKWIEVRQAPFSTLLEITVPPLENNKTRKMRIISYIQQKYIEIEVIQRAR